MASMTIRNLDQDLIQALETQAVRHGVTAEAEARRLLIAGVKTLSSEPAVASLVDRRMLAEEASRDRQARRWPRGRERAAEIQEILSLGQRLPEPFDLKAFSDALSGGTE